MKSTIVVLLALVCAAVADVSDLPDHNDRSITWDRIFGKGRIFGSLGSNDQGLYGKGGYKQTIFNDARGKASAQAYGTRVLSPDGDSTHFGGKVDWANDNAKAALDISKQIHGKTTVEASGAGVWKLDKNTNLSAGGAVSQVSGGKPDIAVKAEIEHKF